MPGLGRLHAPDVRDTNYLMVATPRAIAVVARRNHLWAYFDAPLDQGNTGTCVAHGWKHWLSAAPVIQSDVDEPPYPFDMYDEMILLDEFPENDHDADRQMGTSVRAGAKVLQGKGYLKSYSWAWSVETAADWLAGIDAEGRFVGGPVVIGVEWRDGMWNTDSEGFLRVSGNVVGGHCVCLLGWNEKRGFAYGINSWGTSFGVRGRFYLAGEDFKKLMQEGGEVCTSAEVRLG